MKSSGFWISVVTLAAMTNGGAALAAQPPGAPPVESQGRPSGPGRPSLIVAALDTNKDGDLSVEELANAPVALKSLDKNKDGKLAAEEMRPAPAPVIVPASDIVSRLMEFDRNSDGKLALSELPARMKSLVKDADTNKDSVLTQSELTVFTKKQEAIRRKETEQREKAEAERQKAEGTTPPAPRPGGPGRVAPIVAAMDINKDGEVSTEEMAGAAVSLKTLDKNSDGKITPEELRPAPPPEPAPAPAER